MRIDLYNFSNLNEQFLILKEYCVYCPHLIVNKSYDQLIFQLYDDKDKVILLNLDGSEIFIEHSGLNFYGLSPSGKILLTIKGATAIVWDPRNGKKIFEFNFKDLITDFSFESEYKIAFACGKSIIIVPTPEGLLREKISECQEDAEASLLEEILHLTSKSPQKTYKLEADF